MSFPSKTFSMTGPESTRRGGISFGSSKRFFQASMN